MGSSEDSRTSICRRLRIIGSPYAQARNQARRRAHAARSRLRCAHLRGQLCRSRGGARARVKRRSVLVVDRYEIGERQTSACGIPTAWLTALGLQESLQQTFGELVIHTPYATARLRSAVDVLDVRLPHAVLVALGSGRHLVRVRDRHGVREARLCGPYGPRRDPRAADRRCARLAARARRRRRTSSRPMHCCRAGSKSTRSAPERISRSGSTARTCPPATAGGFRPTTSFGSASGRSTRGITCASRRCGWRSDLDADTVRYQGNWIPHALRDATEDGVFFAGDSAGHCLPLTAEGIRTALYFGLACGRELRAVRRRRAVSSAGARPLPRLLRLSRAAVPLDAAGAAAGPAGRTAGAGRVVARDAGQALRRLVLRALPERRAPGFRRLRCSWASRGPRGAGGIRSRRQRFRRLRSCARFLRSRAWPITRIVRAEDARLPALSVIRSVDPVGAWRPKACWTTRPWAVGRRRRTSRRRRSSRRDRGRVP